MTNLIFITLFFNENYIKLLYLLLESLYIYGNLSTNIDIIIYTSTKFSEIIMKSNLYINKISFRINNNYNSVSDACFSRLDLFTLNGIDKYEKILYLDSDNLIINDINKIFNLALEDKIYAKMEGYIDARIDEHFNDNFFSDCWGNSFFSNELSKYDDLTAFSSGVLLFNNCQNIKDLFQKINDHVNYDKNNNKLHEFFDQPYFVYNCKKYNMINNTLLEIYIKSNLTDFLIENHSIKHDRLDNSTNYNQSEKKEILNMLKKELFTIEDIKKTNSTIIHFNCKPGDFFKKYLVSTNKYYNFKNIYINQILNDVLNYLINNNLEPMSNKKYFNLVNLLLTKNENEHKILILGCNDIISIIIFLIINSKIKILLKINNTSNISDISNTNNLIEKINNDFNNRILLINDETNLPLVISDIIYFNETIDTNFDYQLLNTNLEIMLKIINNNTILIMDNYDIDEINDIWNIYIKKHNLKKIDSNLDFINKHDIRVFYH